MEFQESCKNVIESNVTECYRYWKHLVRLWKQCQHDSHRQAALAQLAAHAEDHYYAMAYHGPIYVNNSC